MVIHSLFQRNGCVHQGQTKDVVYRFWKNLCRNGCLQCDKNAATECYTWVVVLITILFQIVYHQLLETSFVSCSKND